MEKCTRPAEFVIEDSNDLGMSSASCAEHREGNVDDLFRHGSTSVTIHKLNANAVFECTPVSEDK